MTRSLNIFNVQARLHNETLQTETPKNMSFRTKVDESAIKSDNLTSSPMCNLPNDILHKIMFKSGLDAQSRKRFSQTSQNLSDTWQQHSRQSYVYTIDKREDLRNLLDSSSSKRNIKLLKIAGDFICDHDIQDLDILLPELKMLDLSRNFFLSGYAIEKLSKLTNIEQLNLAHCQGISDFSILHIKQLQSLKQLNLDGCVALTDEGIQHLSSLQKLENLDASNCPLLSDASLEHLSKLEKLQHLSICASKITPTGLKHFCKNSTILSLNVAECKDINDESIRIISSMPNLQSINLKSCPKITHAGILQLKQLKNLRLLNLFYCNQLSANDLKKIKEELPNTRVLMIAKY